MALPPSLRSRLGLLAPCLLAACLMAPGLGEPYGGFLAFSEAWYTLVARGFETVPWWAPQVAPGKPDLNLPPLFAWLLHGAFSVLGPGEAVARSVAILGACLAVGATSALGGATAGLLLASAPAFVLVGRNVQPDGWAIALAVLAWALWRDGRGARRSGLVFGLAVLAKPTVLAYPATLVLLATLRARGAGWLRLRHLVWGGLAALAPGAWVVLQLAVHRQAFLDGVRHGSGAFEWPTLALLPVLLGEVAFLGFPALVVLVPVAVLRGPRDRHHAAALALLVVGILSFAVLHYHGYYLVGLLPAAALLAAPPLRSRPALTAAVVLLGCCASLIQLGGHKLGRGAVASVARSARGSVFLLDPAVYEGYWTLFALYGAPRAIIRSRCVEASQAVAVVAVPAPPGVHALVSADDLPRAPGILGMGIAEVPANPHRLAWGPLRLARPRGGRRPSPALAGFFEAPPGATLYAWRVPAGLRACPAPP